MATLPELGFQIILKASEYVRPDNICQENQGANSGVCMTEISKYFHNGKVYHEAYCTTFAWVVVDKACNELGVDNYLPKTAGARDLLNKSQKAGFFIDRTPVPGALFVRHTTAVGATGHTGVVVNVMQDGFCTVEANMTFTYYGKKYEGIWYRTYKFSDIQKLDFNFIHTELMAGSGNEVEVDFPAKICTGAVPFTKETFLVEEKAMNIGGLLVVGLALCGAYWLYENKIKK